MRSGRSGFKQAIASRQVTSQPVVHSRLTMDALAAACQAFNVDETNLDDKVEQAWEHMIATRIASNSSQVAVTGFKSALAAAFYDQEHEGPYEVLSMIREHLAIMAGSCFPPSAEFLGWAVDEVLCAFDNDGEWDVYYDIDVFLDWEAERVENIANVALFQLPLFGVQESRTSETEPPLPKLLHKVMEPRQPVGTSRVG